MNAVASCATLPAVATWLREGKELRGLAALPLGARERAQRANERLRRMMLASR
jgi:hypothetical protein